MTRAFLGLALICLAGSAAAQQAQRVALLPAGGMWQGVPYAATRERAPAAKPASIPLRREEKRAAPKKAPPIAHRDKVERAAKAAPAAGPKARPPRHAVAAAAPPPTAPASRTAGPGPMGPAARASELSRRIGILAPGAKLGEPIFDPDNPPWRRTPADRVGPDGRALALPLDDTGRSGIVARGYREEPSWSNPHGNTGATFGLRTKF
ncbi:MAG: hypothetical protein KIT16_10430 [Rhodospirillaceae bacterium]|nr:hypothetical protein [Rhodospirillaceae bacterium]